MIPRPTSRPSDPPPVGALRKRCGVWNFVAGIQLLALAVWLCAGVVLTGCSSEDEHPDWAGGFGGQQGSGVATGPCGEGQERECGYPVDETEGVVTCYRGTQVCQDGMWSRCENGDLTTEVARSPKSLEDYFRRYDVEAASTAPKVKCTPADACDPYCYEAAETPGTFTPGVNITDWDLCDAADTTPPTECMSSTSTVMACAHDQCTVGGALTPGCNSCVDLVCAVKPNCCTTGSGPPTWDASCVQEAYVQCANSPPPLGLCDFGVYSKSTIVTANGPNFGSNSRVGGLGNLIIDTDGATGFPTSVVTPCNLWVKNTNSAGPIPLSGGIFVGGSGVFDAGSATQWTGNMSFGRGLYLYNQNTINGKVTASGNYSLAAGTPTGCSGPTGWPPSITTNAFNIGAQGTSNTINGSAWAAGAIDTYPTINPTTGLHASQGTTVVPPPNFSLPSTPPSPTVTTCSGATNFPAVATACSPSSAGTISGSAGNYTLTINNGVCTLPGAGNYGTVVLSNSAKVVLNGSGTYTFKNLNGGGANDGGIQLGTPTNTTGNYTTTVCGQMSLGGNQNIIDSTASTAAANNKTPVLTTPSRLRLYVLGTDTATPCNGTQCAVSFGVDALFAGILSIPNGTFYSSNNNTTATSFNGAVWANAFNVGTKFNLSQMSKSTCEALNLPGTLPGTPMCPISNTTTVTLPALPDSSAEPCRIGSDCQNNQRCTNADTGSAGAGYTPCAHSKCSANTTKLDSTCDPCVARICANAGTATCCTGSGNAWTAACVSAVATLCDAECGTGTGVGDCQDNSTLSTTPETGCTGYDLAVDYVCNANTIPVCNHGSSVFGPALVTVGYWDIADRVFGATSPSSTTRDGTCTASLTIQPGECQNITSCTPSMATGTSYTLMVDPDAALSECGTGANANRRLDNWSWRDQTFACITNPPYVEYEYQPTCPEDSFAAWKYLKWVTTNSAGSSVVFKAKAGRTPSALTAATYATVATNTTSCTEANADAYASGCAVNLATSPALGLTKPHPQYLSIRVEKNLAPTVTKWEVSYTCEYDQ